MSFAPREEAGRRVAARLSGIIDSERLKTDPLYTYAYSGDASFYRLIPGLVVIVNTEAEVRAVIAAAREEAMPITFRAAGTSLSGQAVTDGVLCVLGDGWRKIEISPDAERITLGPSIVVADANKALRPLNKKIGPDPASQAAAKIGGVVANNSSGMCCGVIQNTYHTMHRLRLVLNDGTILDSGDPASIDAFRIKRADIVEKLQSIASEVRADNELVDLIRRKYQIKNTVGYSLNALIDFTDPIDILTHLMVGSEGTLGFVSEITYNTVPDHPHKATTLVPFSTAERAAEGIRALHMVGVSSAEFMERRALATVEDRPALAPYLPHLTESSPAVLIEIMAESADALEQDMASAVAAITSVGALSEIIFTRDPDHQAAMWDVRKGLFASAGADRPKGTSMLTEDVAVPIDKLPEVVGKLRDLLDRHGYQDAIIFGHALAGNLHFQMAADFTDPVAVTQFEAFCDDLADLVSIQYQGSMKAEHGTGRAVAPYVEREWGEKAYAIMGQIKAVFDPDNLFNPGVLLNDDKSVHVSHLKAMGTTDDIVDMCIECGFCEPACPSAGLTLTPRQRISLARESSRLERSGEAPDLLEALQQGYVHAGMDTCAACNLCSTRCPVGIETGSLIMKKRSAKRSALAETIAGLAANNLDKVERTMSLGIAANAMARSTLGDPIVDQLSGALNTFSRHKFPKPNRNLTKGPGAPKANGAGKSQRGQIVYFPACASRLFGLPKTSFDLLPITDAMIALLQRVGYHPVLSQKLEGQCCGQPFQSKGFASKAQTIASRLHDELERTRPEADTPIVTDMSTCALHLQQDGMAVQDSVAFLEKHVLPHLTITRQIDIVAVHHNCSAQRLKEQAITEKLARACAKTTAVLTSITCCGYAGDKGMYQPELNAHALRFAKNDVPENCTLGVSTVSSCAIGLSDHLSIPFVGMASLLEYVSRPLH